MVGIDVPYSYGINLNDAMRKLFWPESGETQRNIGGSAIPGTLLIESDESFAHGISKQARNLQAPFRWIRSADQLQTHHNFNYDLVLISKEAVPKDLMMETLHVIKEAKNNVTVIVVGKDDPTKKEEETWSPLVSRFLRKEFGAESVFNDAVVVYGLSN
jgi:DNA-binding NtrC family response regulator